jgi:hypothetical protein
VNAAWTDQANVFTLNQRISKNPRPALELLETGTDKFRLYKTGGHGAITQNLFSDGTNWQRDDVALPGTLLFFLQTGGLYYFSAPAGANPAAIVSAFGVDPDGLVQLSGGRLAFPATQIPSANPNALDDYEEGTWTPAFVGDGGAASGQVYAGREGHYTKVGNLVTCWYYLQLSTLGTIPGNVLVGGFPFTSANIQPGGFGSAAAFWNAWSTNFTVMQTNMIVNDTRAYIIANTAAAAGISGTVTQANMNALTGYRGCVIYRV